MERWPVRREAARSETAKVVSKYAVYDTARIYHLMRDENHTKCGVYVSALDSNNHDQGYGSPPSKIVESIPDGLRLCQHCSGERSEKEGGKR